MQHPPISVPYISYCNPFKRRDHLQQWMSVCVLVPVPPRCKAGICLIVSPFRHLYAPSSGKHSKQRKL